MKEPNPIPHDLSHLPNEVTSDNGKVTLQLLTNKHSQEVLDLIKTNAEYWSRPPDQLKNIDSIEKVEKFLIPQSGKKVQFGIRDSNGALVGLASIRPSTGEDIPPEGPYPGHISRYINEGSTGQGYATEAAKLLTIYGLTHMGYEIMATQTLPINLGAQISIEKVGFTIEGVVERTYGDQTFELVEYSFDKSQLPLLQQ